MERWSAAPLIGDLMDCVIAPLDFTLLFAAWDAVKVVFPFSFLSWLIAFFTQLVGIAPQPPVINLNLIFMTIPLFSWIADYPVISDVISLCRWLFSVLFCVSFVRSTLDKYL